MMNAEKYLTALLLAAGTAVYATFTDGGAGVLTPVELSGFAAGLLKAVLAVGLFWSFDRYVLTDLDTVAELKAGNVAYALMLVALAILLAATVATAQPPTASPAGTPPACVCSCACSVPAIPAAAPVLPSAVVPAAVRPAHVDTVLAYVGTVERGGANRGPHVERFLRAVGLGPGQPWCAAFVSYALDAAAVRGPFDGRGRVVRSGLAARFITSRGIRASEALRGTKSVPDGSVVVWRRGSGPFGHAGFVMRWRGARGETVEGNTSSGAGGSQADGEGVWRRTRTVQPGSHFRIVSFTPVG